MCPFSAIVKHGHLWGHSRQWDVRRVHAEGAEEECRAGRTCFPNYCPVQPSGCGSWQKIHRQRPESLFHESPAEASWKKSTKIFIKYWQKCTESSAFQCAHNRRHTLRAKARTRAQFSAGPQREQRGCGPAVRPSQHHLQHGCVSDLLLLRLDHSPHFKIHTGNFWAWVTLG